MPKAIFAILGLMSALTANVAEAQETEPYRDWGGAYAGLNIGYIRGATGNEWNSPGAGITDWQPDGDISYASLIGGANAGYLAQAGRFVFGGEVDINRFSLNGNDDEAAGLVNGIAIDTTATLRARMGIAIRNTLLYATTGFALSDYTKTDESLAWSQSDRLKGWTVGAGIEQALSDDWSVRFDYSYADFGKVESRLAESDVVYYNHRALRISTHALRIGVNYRF